MHSSSDPDISLRPATVADCTDIARFYQMSSDGVADYIWSKMAEPEETPLQVGAKRYQRVGTNFSYQNCTLAEYRGKVVGMLFAFPMHCDPSYLEEDPVLLPYSQLEQDNSYYISGIAVDQSCRGLGIGLQMMELAEQQCTQLGLENLSLIVFEENQGAKRLYERIGYREIDRRQIAPHSLIRFTADAILMSKSVPTKSL